MYQLFLFKSMKVTVLYNRAVSSLESEADTPESALMVGKELAAIGYDVNLLAIDLNTWEQVREISADLVFNLLEWTGDAAPYTARVLEILEKKQIPYTGSRAWGYLLSCDKKVMKGLMRKNRIPTPAAMIFETGKEKIKRFTYPVILKPVFEHCGCGVGQDSVVESLRELRTRVAQMMAEWKQPILAEEFIEGREVHVTVLENKGRPWVLPIAEVVFALKEGFRPLLSYAGKWQEESWEYELSRMQLAHLEPEMERRVKLVAKRAVAALGGADYSRLDMRLRGEQIFVLEINNNPGIDYDDASGIGVGAKAAGLSFGGLLQHIVENAFWRWSSMKGVYGQISA